MSAIVESVAPRYAERRGGGRIVLLGQFDKGVPLRLALSDGPRSWPCHSGIAGQGTVLVPVGQQLSAVLPALPPDAPSPLALVLTPLDGGVVQSLSAFGIDVVAPFYDSQTYALRSVWAPVFATGPREIAQEAAP